MKKVLVYSHDAYGLGNIRRMLEITNHLVNSDPDVSVLLISGSPMLHAFRIPPRVDYIKLPCVARSDKGESVVKSLGLSYDDTIRMRANVIAMAAMDFNPDLILVDKKPFGIANELEQALTLMRKRPVPPKVVLLLRDILDEPEATMRQWLVGNYHGAIKDAYDQVLVVGESEIFDAAEEYCFPASTTDKLRYCGYIKRPAPAKTPKQVREQFGLGEEPMVLVTAGGGADGSRMMMAYLEGLLGRPRRGFSTLLVTGPEMSPDQRAMVIELANRAGGVIVREFCDDMMSAMNAADVVVSMGGYNTVCELLTLKKRTIIVPRVTPVLEQWIRAERMQDRGLLRALHPNTLTPETLIDSVVAELSRDDVANTALDRFEMQGLPRIAEALSELLEEGAERASAAASFPRNHAPSVPRSLGPVRSLISGALQRAFGSVAGA
jgi:predicted glycosyltransferase